MLTAITRTRAFQLGLRSASASASGLLSRRCQSTAVKLNPNALDLRVGFIKCIKRHENADSLYVSQVRIGSDDDKDVLQVCSGLVGLVAMEQLDQSRVVVVKNLKASKMRGVKSEAMLLCAESKNTVDDGEVRKVTPVVPPTDADIGDAITFEGGIDSGEVKKSKLKGSKFMEYAEHLSVDDRWRVVWNGGEAVLVGCSVGEGDIAYIGGAVR
jgi:aminoacyl tRNA synthase complex-interacting multifunctional protein 1